LTRSAADAEDLRCPGEGVLGKRTRIEERERERDERDERERERERRDGGASGLRVHCVTTFSSPLLREIHSPRYFARALARGGVSATCVDTTTTTCWCPVAKVDQERTNDGK